MMQANFHGIDVDIATQYGIEEALMINSFQYWLNKNYVEGRNQNDGRTWTFNTNETLAKSFPYMNARKVRYTIDRLVSKGVLLKGNYNKAQYDRTMWYAFVDEEKWLYTVRNDKAKERENSHLTKMANGFAEIDDSHLTKMANGFAEIDAPIPVTNTITNQEIKDNSLSSSGEESTIFTQELPLPSANRPTVDKEVETLTADDVVKYLAARLMTLPLEEAQLFLTYYRGQGWYVGNTPVSSWRDKAEGWFLRYKQRQNEAAKKPVASGRKPKQDFTNLPDYSFDTSGDETPSNVIDSFATAIFPKIGGE